MQKTIIDSFLKLKSYCEKENFKGWDPYDLLNSSIPFNWLGKWGELIATQVHLRNPINIRPLLGIKKDYVPKGVGLFLKAYCNLYNITKEKKYLEKADWLFNWLANNYSKGYSGHGWGCNFPWASLADYKKAYLPSVVVTSAVIDGIYEYYKITNSCLAKNIIISASQYVLMDIPITQWENGISFAYTHKAKGVCYNASLHAVEILLKAKQIGVDIDEKIIHDATLFVVNKQKKDGVWYYSYDPIKMRERKQIDFHQGFILVSLHNISTQAGIKSEKIHAAITKGVKYYWKQQFASEGRSYYRLPKKLPVDIHNQSQGIITFSLLSDYDEQCLNYAKTILDWTIKYMQHKNGYFYYRRYPLLTDTTPYIRWGQAWMLLAFSEFLKRNYNYINL